MWALWALRPPASGAAPALLRVLQALSGRGSAAPLQQAAPLSQRPAPHYQLLPGSQISSSISTRGASSSAAAAASGAATISAKTAAAAQVLATTPREGDAWASALGFAAAAWLAAVAGVGGGAIALAETDPAPAVALQEAQQHIDRTWTELTDDWARAVAMRPPGSKPQTPPQRPVASLSPDGQQLRVTVPLRPGCDASAVIREVSSSLQQLSRGSASCHQRQQAGAVGDVSKHRWEVSHVPAGGGMRHALSVEAAVPLSALYGGGSSGGGSGSTFGSISGETTESDSGAQGSNSSSSGSSAGGSGGGTGAMGAGRVVFVKDGALLPGERLALTRVVRAANLTFQDAPGRSSVAAPWGASPDLDPLSAIVEEAERAIAAQITRPPGFGDLADFLEYVEARAAEMQELFPLEDEEATPPEGAALPPAAPKGDAAAAAASGAAAAAAQGDASSDAARRAKRLAARRQRRADELAAIEAEKEARRQRLESERAAAAAKEEEERKAKRPWETPEGEKAVRVLEGMGARVYLPGGKDDIEWGVLAGYEDQKRAIEDCLLLPLQHPELYESIAQRTRANGKGSRPRAVLFEGPPGTGKTTSARVLSTQASVPLVYIPLEALMSKWYGESEGNLAKLFKSARSLGGCLVFLDELDSLATSRDKDMHEASRRVLAVLLREIDGFEAGPSVVIGATNRKVDLDPALLSRFSFSLVFDLPDGPCRTAILGRYAKQLTEGDRTLLAAQTGGFSGRDLRDICEQAERRWASKIIRKEAPSDSLPPLDVYLSAAAERKAAKAHGGGGASSGGPGGRGRGSGRGGLGVL